MVCAQKLMNICNNCHDFHINTNEMRLERMKQAVYRPSTAINDIKIKMV